MFRTNELEVVRGGVIFGNRAEFAALKQADRQIEARRAVLAFVIAVRGKVQDRRRQSGLLQRVDHRAVDLRVSAPAFLVRRPAAVSDHGNDEPVLDACGAVLVAGEPGDCADRAGREQKPVAVSRSPARQAFGEMRQQRDARTIVVRERGMADVGGQQEFVFRLSFVEIFAVGEMPVGQARVDHDLVGLVPQRFEAADAACRTPNFPHSRTSDRE